ncbi:hypothetical protein CCP3SC15_6640003 [Gammaproteobacteria bacterium]
MTTNNQRTLIVDDVETFDAMKKESYRFHKEDVAQLRVTQQRRVEELTAQLKDLKTALKNNKVLTYKRYLETTQTYAQYHMMCEKRAKEMGLAIRYTKEVRA